MISISREFHDSLVGTVEDAVSFELEEAFKNGEPISGETAWNIVLCRATAKVLEFEGHFVPSDMDMGGDVSMKILPKEDK